MSDAHQHTRPPKKILGWREWVDLPELGISLTAKVDSGARTSALHATHISVIDRHSGRYVHFQVQSEDGKSTLTHESPMLEMRPVKSSDGDVSDRPVILMYVILGGEERQIEVTLIDRSIMGHKMLLGRQAIRGHYLIDPGKTFQGPHPLNPPKKPKARP